HKMTIPVVLSTNAFQGLDDPLQRMLRDTNYVNVPAGALDVGFPQRFAEQLGKVRGRHLRTLGFRLAPLGVVAGFVGIAAWWSVTNLNVLEETRRRDQMVDALVTAKQPFQNDRV